MSDTAVITRTVFPGPDAQEVLPLYVEVIEGSVRVDGRESLVVAGRVSLGTYMNAFPAAVWQAETDLPAVTLEVETVGTGEVMLVRSDADATATEISRHRVDGTTTTRLVVALEGFDDGGCLWIDLASEGEMLLSAARWQAAGIPPRTATIAMATFNRPDDCVAHLSALAADEHLSLVVDRIVVTDQGTALVRDHPGFPEVERALGDRLDIVTQPNLGGSGGFSRGMLETLRRGESESVLLLDDDAISEPEAVLRAVRLQAAAREPLIVGGGMLHIDDRNVLYAQSEQWDRRIGWVALNRPGAYNHDFARVPFRAAPFFHRRQRSDFAGWWMCLIPVSVLSEAGLSLPLFLKGDDVEFGLRAQEFGVRTVSPTGVALWHLGWGGKAPTRTWEAYFLHRNRLIAEALHRRGGRPTALALHSLLGDLKPLLTLQYSAVRLRQQAVSDFLDGPEHLPGWLRTRVADVRALWSRYPDAQPVTDAPPLTPGPAPARGRVRQALRLAGIFARHQLVPARAGAQGPHIAAEDLGWWTFAALDAAWVDTPDGRAVVHYRRSRRESARALRRSLRLHARLWLRWPELQATYRTAAPGLASPASWQEIFGR